MVEVTTVYQGQLHCEAVHTSSSARLQTDAPKDNNGRGESFSPTDLVGTALITCILTTIAISAEREGIEFQGASGRVLKEMVSDPNRRIGRLLLEIKMPQRLDEQHRKKFEHIAVTCPVHRSLHPDVKIEMKFDYV